MSDSPADGDLVFIDSGETAMGLGIIEYDLDICGGYSRAGPLVQEGGSLLSAEVVVGIAQNEADSGKEVALSRSVPSDDNIRSGGEGLDNGLVLVANTLGSACVGIDTLDGGAR